MARWEGGGRERLQQAALELFTEHGFDGVTVTQIAETAGLTERTFFRHFADKREVLFTSQDTFARAFLDGLETAGSSDPMTQVAAAIGAGGAMFTAERRPWSRARQGVIDDNVALREREQLKLGGVAIALANALRARGVDDLTATLTAEVGMSIFRTAFATWVAHDEQREFPEVLHDVLGRAGDLQIPHA